MKINFIFRRDGRIFAEMKAFCSKCLAKDIKHEQLLRRQPKKIELFDSFILFNSVCFNYVAT